MPIPLPGLSPAGPSFAACQVENAHLGVRVNALAPGWVRTPLTAGLDEVDGLTEQLRAAVPVHRAAEPEEMAGVAIFLCSDAASYVTDQVFVADGGQMIRGLLHVEDKTASHAQWESWAGSSNTGAARVSV